MSQDLMIASAMLLLAAGLLHLVLTFVGPKLRPRDSTLQARMGEVAMGISRHTTMWRAWVGFNASHSLSLVLFGLLYSYLAARQSTLLFGSPFLVATGFAFLVAYLGLAVRYWFYGPVACVGMALGLYAVAIIFAHT